MTSECRGLLLALLLVPALCAAQGAAARERALKAAILVTFTQYVLWPPDAFAGPESPFCLGVLGADPFGRVLDATAEGRSVHGRRIAVRRFAEPKEARACHLLFVGRQAAALAELRGASLLTVGEDGAFPAAGVIIALEAEGGRLRFDVDLAAAEAARLSLSSQMLRLARRVRRPAQR